MKTGDPTYRWTTDLEARARLRIGTVLETDDCAYLRVDAITPEGVICPNIFSPGALVTWAKLERCECIIYSQPGDPDHEQFQTPLPRLIERSGGLRMEADDQAAPSGPPGAAAVAARPPKLLGDEELERALAGALARSAPAGWERITLEVATVWGSDPEYSIVTSAPGGERAALAPTPEVLALVSALRAEMRLLRGPLCSRVELHVEHSGGSCRFRTQVHYEGETPS
jgi:hypothetical protein